MEEIKVYTLKDVADIIKVTERTLLTYIKEGKLKAKKIGGKWIVSQANLQEFINT